MKYQVVLQKTPEDVTALVPGLPGCISEGASKEDALLNITSAIAEYLEASARIRYR